ncbi:hypothetical protein JAAARDRAFT_53716 [Jaapia argillacea MUCL 33604]|uniref:Uncharacterized protein n=1 Tax=Jaapia argillacea MUCL 33604 TaxID=933084 RepID=A0A067QBI2_9AGAM|nr:hypothetical protein JAAARDRAFT_53716 [Jaapia argillacea MUCL 33604]
MSIPRSKSAPQFVAHQRLELHTHIHGTRTPPHAGRRTLGIQDHRSLTAAHSPIHSPAATPRVEDPFNLGGFFPSHIGIVEEEQEWSWLRYSEEGGGFQAQREDVHPMFSPPVSEGEPSLPATPQSEPLTPQELEEEARKTIEGEDKFGVLSIHNPFHITDARPESYFPDLSLLSPYTDDDPVDDDALYNVLCALRRSHTLPKESKETRVGNLGELFSPVDEKPAEDGWTWSLSQGLRMLWA